MFERCLEKPDTYCRWINRFEIRQALKVYARGRPSEMDWLVHCTEISSRYCRLCPLGR